MSIDDIYADLSVTTSTLSTAIESLRLEREPMPRRTPDEIHRDLSAATATLVVALESGDPSYVVNARETESGLWGELLTSVMGSGAPEWAIFAVASAMAESALGLARARQHLYAERTSHV